MLLSPPNLPAGDRPRERLWALGPAALTTAELVAILIGTGGAATSVLEVSGRLLEVGEGSLRRLATRPRGELLQTPGVGPTKEERENGFYDLIFIAEGPNGQTARAAVKGDMDPGYGSTAKILAESALCLAFDSEQLTSPGGVLTPAEAMGDLLLERLQKAGIEFEVLEGA